MKEMLSLEEWARNKDVNGQKPKASKKERRERLRLILNTEARSSPSE